MAEIGTKTNGEKNGHSSLEESDNENKMLTLQDNDQDSNKLERIRKVDMIVNSQIFREELERFIESQSNPDVLQQITGLLNPGRSGAACPGHCVIPVNDLRFVDCTRFSELEMSLRCKLAAVYRLIDLYGWSENIYNHVTVRASDELEHFLLNPFGLQYPEVTASSLLKVDMEGDVIDPGTTSFTFNRAGFVLHSAVHKARPDVRCCIHVHHPPVVAVSSMKCGLLPVSQEAALIGGISYHDYQGIVVDTVEQETIAKDLGPVNKVLLLRNHGVIVLGETIEEALFYLQNLILACEAQVKLVPIGLDNIQMMSDDARQKVRNLIAGNQSSVTGKPQEQNSERGPFKVWDLEFEAQMRMLDNMGYRTGYEYKYPLIRAGTMLQNEVPLTAKSFIKYINPLKKLTECNKGPK